MTSFIMGSREMYAWVHDNPGIEMRPSSFTNDPFQISRNDDMVAINSALAVDLTGQVAAASLGSRFFSGMGGQVDFIRGVAPIGIAHPDFRGELLAAARQRHFIFPG